MAFDPQEAIEFMRTVDSAESTNRSDAMSDLRFSYGDQWEDRYKKARDASNRPCHTINKVDAYIRQVTNAQRQQRPRIKVHPMDDLADKKIAEVMTGIMRHIEVNSDADQAYDTAFNFAVRMGWGYFRVVTDYMREDSFDQDIFLQQIENPFSVYFDSASTLPDGSDADKCLITDMISKSEFKRLYPGADISGFEARGSGDATLDWYNDDEIRIAEYFTVEREKQKLLMLSDKSVIWADQMPPVQLLMQAGLSVTGDRDSYRRIVEWRKINASEVLEEKRWSGRWIPVIPVYGDQVIVDNKRSRFGLVRGARDPQAMYNYWRTAMTESIAMATKAKWLIAEGQDEGHENEWNNANTSPVATMRYKMTDVDGREAPRPERIQPEPPPAGAMEAAIAISNDLQSVLGIFDPSMGKPSGPKSGTAIRAEQGQSEQSNFHYYDNLTRSIKHVGRIILDLVPKIYDKQRIMRIIGDDGKPDLVTINERQDQEGINRILNDVTIGNYDVVMEVGPGFASKRAEAAEAMMQMVQGNQDLMKIAGDLIFRNMDFPGADIIADRLAAANPFAQIDEKSDVPPQAQMMIKNLQQQLQQSQQQMQGMGLELKYKGDLEKYKQDEETKREHMRVTVKAHESETWAQEERDQFESVERTKLHDTLTRAITSQNVEEIKATAQLMLHHLDTKRLNETAEAQDKEIAAIQ